MTPDRATPARAVLLGLCAAVLGVAAHGEAGGVVAASATAMVVPPAVVLATALLGARPHPPRRLAAVLTAGQLALHLAVSGNAHHHVHDGGAHTAPQAHGPAMVGAHLAVAVLVAGGIAEADRVLARVVRRRFGHAVAGWARRLAGPPPVPGRPSGIAPPRPARAARQHRAAVTHHPRRGPPSPHPRATTPRHGRTPPCPRRGPRPPARAATARSPRS